MLKSTLLTLTLLNLLFLTASYGENLRCSIRQTVDTKEGIRNVELVPVFWLDEEDGKLAFSKFDGPYKSCQLDERSKKYAYEYGEYFVIEAKCSGFRLLGHGSNHSTVTKTTPGKSEIPFLTGRFVKIRKEEQTAEPVTCSE